MDMNHLEKSFRCVGGLTCVGACVVCTCMSEREGGRERGRTEGSREGGRGERCSQQAQLRYLVVGFL